MVALEQNFWRIRGYFMDNFKVKDKNYIFVA